MSASVMQHASQLDVDEYEESGSEDGTGLDGQSRKRKRPVTVSCELCKQRKVKCDRTQPSCGWCLRNNQICEYKERKKPGLRAGYGRELESRLDNLESVLQDQQQLLQRLATYLPQQAQHTTSQQSPSTLSISRQETTPYVPKPSSYSGSAIDASSPHGFSHGHRGSFGAMPPPHMQHPQQAASSAPSYTEMQSTGHGTDYAPTDPPLESPSLNITESGSTSKIAAVSVAQDGDLPPYDLLYALVDLFFRHVQTWCPVLHRRTTLETLFGSSGLEEADRILLHAIVATTLRFSTDPRLDEQSRERYHAKSKQRVLLYGLDNSSVKALQALVILALDIVGTSNGPPGWNVLAMITRSVVQLGLAVETTSRSISPLYPSIYTLRATVLPEPKDWIEEESRRRLFWIVYLLDRYATISTAFEFALDEKEIDRRIPCRDDYFARNIPVETKWFPCNTLSAEKPENLGSFSYYIEVLLILSKVHQFLKKPVDIGALPDVENWQREYRELDSVLNTYKFNLPSEYGNLSRIFNANTPGNSKIVNCMWIMLHVTYNTVVIRLHSSAAYPTTRSPIFTPSFSASQRCQTAAEDIAALCLYAKSNNMLPNLGPTFAFSLWVAARMFLVHGSTIDHQVNPAIHALVETLGEIGRYWKVAERYAALLQRVLDEYRESERQPTGMNGERVTPSTVRILADMRRTAYDLDVLISRQPRQYLATIGKTPTPARTPGANELEYLDVFDFFNVPRLTMPAMNEANASGRSSAGVEGGNGNGLADQGGDLGGLGASNEFNITDFTFDVNSDWFMSGNT